MRIAVIFNPAAGRSGPKTSQLPKLISWFDSIGYQAVPHPTESTGHGTNLARDCQKRFDAVAAWGGDGTLNEVAAGLVGSKTPLVVLPGGTVNVFARECGIPLILEKAVRELPNYRVQEVSLGKAGERPFLMMAGIGLDAEVVFRLERRQSDLKRRWGSKAFVYEGYRQWRRFRFPPVRLTWDGGTLVASSVVVGNLRRYAHRFFITPHARLDESKLEVVAFTGKSRWALIRFLFGVLGGFHLRLSDVKHWMCDEIRVAKVPETEVDVHYQLDGEPAGLVPVTIGVAPEPLAVLLPKDALKSSKQ